MIRLLRDGTAPGPKRSSPRKDAWKKGSKFGENDFHGKKKLGFWILHKAQGGNGPGPPSECKLYVSAIQNYHRSPTPPILIAINLLDKIVFISGSQVVWVHREGFYIVKQ